MKKILALLFFVVFSNTYSQLTFDKWEIIETIDEFGDPTGNNVKRFLCEGTFSNSATSNDNLILKIIDYGKSISIELFEYNSPPSASLTYQSAFGNIRVKFKDGTVKSYKAFALKDGGLYFSEKSGKDFINLIQDGKGQSCKILIDSSSFSDYGSSIYVATFITQSI